MRKIIRLILISLFLVSCSFVKVESLAHSEESSSTFEIPYDLMILKEEYIELSPLISAWDSYNMNSTIYMSKYISKYGSIRIADSSTPSQFIIQDVWVLNNASDVDNFLNEYDSLLEDVETNLEIFPDVDINYKPQFSPDLMLSHGEFLEDRGITAIRVLYISEDVVVRMAFNLTDEELINTIDSFLYFMEIKVLEYIESTS